MTSETIKQSFHIIDCDTIPECPREYEVFEHNKIGQLEFDYTKIQLYIISDQTTPDGLPGYIIWEQLKGKLTLNVNVLRYLLDNPEIIPIQWRGKIICFWGTIFCDTYNNNHMVYCLHVGLDGSVWWDERWIGYRFFEEFSAAILNSTPN